jgi:hypothetical protein
MPARPCAIRAGHVFITGNINMPICRSFVQALFRTRTGDPLLTIVRQLKREGRLAPWTMPNIGPQYRLLSERPSVKRMLEAEGIVAYPDD